jgi:hypothetical protein
MRMPRRARASGMPTAQPTMTPRLELEPLLDELVLPLLLVVETSVGGGVTRAVFSIVTTPADPDETICVTEVMGSGVLSERDDDGAGREDGSGVLEAWLPPPEVAMPVIEESVGAESACF